MKKKLTLLLTCLFIGISLVTAQTRQVQGVVLSEEDGQPIVGASILVQGTNLGVISDMDGHFVLSNVPKTAKELKVSYVGMQTVKVAIKPNMKITLRPNAELLDEVVVVGYGTGQKLGSVVGSVSQVSSKKLEAKPSANAMDALQGQVAGFDVYTSSGEPGTVSSSYIRGVGSLTADNEPLYVLDGTPVSSSIMVMLNSNDFESVTVLKDASATAIYGSRAANGVVYVTTKKGKLNEKAVVTVSGSYGMSRLAKDLGNPMNSAELLEYQLGHGFISDKQYEAYKATGYDTNWQDYFFRKDVPTYQSNIAVQGGGEKTTYYLSGSTFYQDGISPRSNYTKYNFRSNIDSRPKEWLRVGANVALAYDEQEQSAYTYIGSNSLHGGIFGSILNQPYFNPYGENGERLDIIPGLNRYSPYYLSDKSENPTNTSRLDGSAYLILTPIEGLTIKSQFGIGAYDYRSTAKQLPSHPSSTDGGNTREKFSRNVKMTITNTAEYKFNIDKVHYFTVLLGQEGIKNKYQMFASKTKGQNDDRLTELASGTSADFLGTDSSNRYCYQFLSFFGRINYSFADKYYADFTVRSDESSRFGADNRSATFFSGGLMWDILKEDFMEDSTDLLTALKLKASVGSTGNASIGNYEHLALVGTSTYDSKAGWYLSSPGNSNLGWEKQIQYNLGVEVALMNRFRFEATFYKKKTSDMLMNVPLPYTAGFESTVLNIGSMSNTGIELTASLDLYKNRDWYVNFEANYSYNKNKITKLFYGLDCWPMPDNLVAYTVGGPVEYYMAKWAGVDPDDGKQMWYLPNSSETTKVYSEDLQQSTGKKRYAPHHGGFGLNVSYKGLSLTSDFSFVLGKYMVNNDYYFANNPTNFGSFNQSKDILKMWKEPGDITDVPVFGSVMQFDTHLLENASFMRLKNLTLGYEFPRSLLEKTHLIKGLKLSVTARNLFTVTDYRGADPEIDTNLTYGAYPNTKQLTFGAQIKF